MEKYTKENGKKMRKMDMVIYTYKSILINLGSYFYLNGDKYVGEWKNDKKHGKGRI